MQRIFHRQDEIVKGKDNINDDENISLIKYLHKCEEYERHSHDFIEIEYVWCGEGYQVINGIEYYVEKGTLLFFNMGDVHSYYTDKELGIINCLLKPEFVNDDLINSENAMDILALNAFNEFAGKINSILRIIKFQGKNFIAVNSIMESMVDEFIQKPAGYKTVLKGYVNILLTKFFRAVRDADTIKIYNDINRIAPEILNYIEENYNKKISLNELARISCYNPSYFSTVFKECVGKTLTEYINEKRIKTAIKILEETDQSIESICFQVGYSDKRHFYKNFKLITGLTPNSFRTEIKK